jgi:hypothetical protein
MSAEIARTAKLNAMMAIASGSVDGIPKMIVGSSSGGRLSQILKSSISSNVKPTARVHYNQHVDHSRDLGSGWWGLRRTEQCLHSNIRELA